MKKPLIAAIVLSLLVFGTWYNERYGMDYVNSLEVNAKTLPDRILIATQGSTFKDAITSKLISSLSEQDYYIKKIDISNLSGEDYQEYQSIIVMHTYEMWTVPRSVSRYLDNVEANKTYILTTSGSGDFYNEEYDGISSASILSNVDDHTAKILDWINHRNTP